MSRLNPRNYQLGLAFNDTDLKEPKHDEIMQWLTTWVKQEVNIRALFRPTYRHRWHVTRHVLDEAATRQVADNPSHRRHQIEDNFYRRHSAKEVRFCGQWQDEPILRLGYQSSEWELPLSSGRGAVMGFCDLYCQYEVGDSLHYVTTHLHSFQSQRTEYGIEQWNFGKVAETFSWQQQTAVLRMFFEVKTKIPSVGELMRQLQLYRTSRTIRTATWIGDVPAINKMIVVAPPNNEAASVCREHRIPFVEYRAD